MSDSDLDADEAVPSSTPSGLINLPSGSCVVHDAGEEIMELYMNLATISTPSGGLGFLDSSSSLLEFDLVIPAPAATASGTALVDLKSASDTASVGSSSNKGSGTDKRQSKGRAGRDRTAIKVERGTAGHAGSGKGKDKGGVVSKDVVVPVQVQQDLNLLKSSKGDTGSVLWRSSLHLARHLLSQHHFPPPPPYSSLFDPSRLRTSRILELGGGTGLLASLLSPLCPEGVYVASDRRENLRLLYRNLELNGRVQPAGAESVSVSPTRRTKSLPKVPTREDEHAVHNTTPSLRSKGTTSHGPPESRYNVQVEEVDWVSIASTRHPQPLRAEERYDLVTAIDCIYNESLCEPLVKTLARYLPVAAGGCALVVVELRSADVLELFLDTWLNDPSGGWTIVRLAEDALGSWEGERPRWVGWVGYRV